MWQPDPEWSAAPGGRGALTEGLWTTRADGADWTIKRVRRPDDDESELLDPHHAGYWFREAEVALAGLSTIGLVAPEVRRVEEDAAGVVIWSRTQPKEPPPGLFVARALGAFTHTSLPDRPWLARGLLRARLDRAVDRGGWPTLARTTVADLADVLWRRRRGMLDRLDDLSQVACHGDAVPANLVATAGERVVALDWASLGLAPAGADLGYYALSCREEFDVLLEAFTSAAVGDCEQIAFAARVMAVYTVFSQAEWALSRVAAGPGALAGKYRHPSVAPYLRALQRLFPQVEALIGT